MNVLNKLSGLTMLIRLFTMLAVLAVASSLPVHDATYAKAITDAIRLGQVETLQTLLEQADDIEELLTAEKFVNLSPLLYACKTNVASIPLLLSLGSDPALGHLETGTTPLIYAARNGEMAAVEVLLDALGKDTDVDVADSHGSTALNVVAITCNAGVAARLIGAGASVLRKDLAGNNAMHVGAWYCKEKEEESARAFATVLMEGLAGEGGMGSLDVFGGTKRSALMLAAMRGNKGFVDVLVEHGASLTLRGDNADNKSAQELSNDAEL